ncbi:MAG TPA: hypothetical protein VIK60_15780 [Vicinamibacterales bacterium]
MPLAANFEGVPIAIASKNGGKTTSMECGSRHNVWSKMQGVHQKLTLHEEDLITPTMSRVLR